MFPRKRLLPKFDYLRPKSLEEALSFLAEHAGEVEPYAGGGKLFILLREGAYRPRYLLDLKSIGELGELSYREGEGLRIGATVTLNELLDSEEVKGRYRAVWEAAKQIGDEAIRNRSTLVGNLCNALPEADLPPALLVHDAEVEIVSAEGERTLAIGDFLQEAMVTAQEPNELVRAVRLPPPPENARGKYLRREKIVGVAVLVSGTQGRESIRVALSCVGPTALRVPEAEKAFGETGSVEERIERAVSALREHLSPTSDTYASAEYRLHLASVLTRRGLRELLEGK